MESETETPESDGGIRLRRAIWGPRIKNAPMDDSGTSTLLVTGRVIREDKLGSIPGETPRLLERLAIDPEQFITTTGRMLRLRQRHRHTDAHHESLRRPAGALSAGDRGRPRAVRGAGGVTCGQLDSLTVLTRR